MSDAGLSQTLIFGHIWQSVALAAVLACVLIAGRRMRGSTRYGLGVAAFLASLALPLAAFIPGETIVAGLLKQLNAPVAMAADAPPAVAAPAEMAAPAAVAITPSESPGVFTLATVPRVEAPSAPIAPSAPVVASEPRGMAFTLPEIKLPDLALPLLGIWLAGSLFLLARTLRDLLAVERLVRRAQPVELPEALKRRFGNVRVAVSPDAPGPMAAGLFRPCIILPPSIALGSPGMAALLEHERAHIVRRDMLAALGQRVVLALLWWSPALHWMSKRIDEEREVACDEAAVDRTGDAKAFARSLTKQAENQLWARAPKLAVGAIGPRSQVGRRIKRLIEIAKGASPAKYSGRLAFAGLALAVAVAAMVTPRFTADAQPPGDRDGVIDLTTPEGRAKADRDRQRDEDRLDGGSDNDRDFSFDFDFDKDFEFFGEDFARLMESLGDEIRVSMAQMTPELRAEMRTLSAEMAALGAEISASVNAEVMREMPAIMEEVRESLEAAGIENWSEFADFDSEELRQRLQAASDEMREKLGPELQAQIREALAEARQEIEEHREEIAAAMKQSEAGMAIAREAMTAARKEIEAARARGDFKVDGEHLNFDFDFGFDIGEQVLEQLRKAGIPVDRDSREFRASGADRSTPAYQLIRAAAECETANANRLVMTDKADVNALLPGRGSALMAAANENCTDVARLLINSGADVNLGMAGFGTPLGVAAKNGSMQVAQLLVNRGADVNKAVSGVPTPLAAAASDGNLEMVKFLVENGADVNRKVSWARSALEAAERKGEDQVAAYLRSKGAVAK